MAEYDSRTIARFWAKVDRRGPTECWLWTASKTEHGYGRFNPGGGPEKAHRIAWEITYGAIPEGMHVLHHCDNPPCVNPAHLWTGTHQDNMADMTKKRRYSPSRGMTNVAAKLTDDEVRKIRTAPGSQREIARRFGVCRGVVVGIIRRTRWAHVH